MCISKKDECLTFNLKTRLKHHNCAAILFVLVNVAAVEPLREQETFLSTISGGDRNCREWTILYSLVYVHSSQNCSRWNVTQIIQSHQNCVLSLIRHTLYQWLNMQIKKLYTRFVALPQLDICLMGTVISSLIFILKFLSNADVEVETIANFNRMKQLCSDISLIVKAMKLCPAVEVSIKEMLNQLYYSVFFKIYKERDMNLQDVLKTHDYIFHLKQ